MLDKYKSILIKDNNTVVFKSEGIKEEFSKFVYLPNAMASCLLLSRHFRPQKIEDYIQQTSGDNALSLGVFRSRQNQAIEEIENRKKIKVLMYRGFISKFGITPLTFKKVFNAMMMEIWNIKPYFSRYCYNSRGISERNVELLHANIDLIKEAQSKDKNNIVPFILYSGVSYENLSKFFDEKIWKILSENSHNKNNLIANRAKEYLIQIFLTNKSNSAKIKIQESLFKDIEFYNKIPSTILNKTIYIGGEDNNKECILAMLNCLSIKDFLKEVQPNGFFMNGSFYTTVYKTIKHAKELEKEYNLNWSRDQWQEKFNEYEKLNSPF